MALERKWRASRDTLRDTGVPTARLVPGALRWAYRTCVPQGIWYMLAWQRPGCRGRHDIGERSVRVRKIILFVTVFALAGCSNKTPDDSDTPPKPPLAMTTPDYTDDGKFVELSTEI